MKTIKILAYVSLILVLTVILGIYSCVTKVKESIDQATEMPANQKHAIVDGKVIIHTQLEPVMGVAFPNTRRCSSTEIEALTNSAYNPPYKSHSTCLGSQCTLKLTFSGEMPKQVDIFVKRQDTDSCIKQTINTGSFISAVGYNAPIGIDGELKDLLSTISGEVNIRKTPKSKFQGHTYFGFGEQARLTLEYRDQTPSDTVLYNGHEVTVIYDQ